MTATVKSTTSSTHIYSLHVSSSASLYLYASHAVREKSGKFRRQVCTLIAILNAFDSVLPSLNSTLFQFTLLSRSLNVPTRQADICKPAQRQREGGGLRSASGEIKRQRAVGNIEHLILLVIVPCHKTV